MNRILFWILKRLKRCVFCFSKENTMIGGLAEGRGKLGYICPECAIEAGLESLESFQAITDRAVSFDDFFFVPQISLNPNAKVYSTWWSDGIWEIEEEPAYPKDSD